MQGNTLNLHTILTSEVGFKGDGNSDDYYILYERS